MSAQARVSWVRLLLTTGFFTFDIFALLYFQCEARSFKPFGTITYRFTVENVTIFNTDTIMYFCLLEDGYLYAVQVSN